MGSASSTSCHFSKSDLLGASDVDCPILVVAPCGASFAVLGLSYYKTGYDPAYVTAGQPTSSTKYREGAGAAVRVWVARQADVAARRIVPWGAS